MSRDGTPYRGVLYAGLMLTDDGPMVLEFNARFGDPEAQVLLPMLDGELAAALLGTAIGDRALMEGSVRPMRPARPSAWSSRREGYPDAPVTGRRDRGRGAAIAPADDGDVLVFHGGTRRSAGGGYETSGGPRGHDRRPRRRRSAEARAAAYRAVEEVRLEGARCRTDVGELHVDDGTDLRDEAG